MKDIMKEYTTEQLRDKLLKCIKVQDRTNKFEKLQIALYRELDKRNRAAIFKVACKVLNNKSGNQFEAAARYADNIIGSFDYFSSDISHEIGSYYTKPGLGAVVVYFD